MGQFAASLPAPQRDTFSGETDVFATVATSCTVLEGGNIKKQRYHKYQTPTVRSVSTQKPQRCSSAVTFLRHVPFCASLHVHNGAFRSRSVSGFNLVLIQSLWAGFGDEEEGERERWRREGHWLSSRAQTCCGHPVRPLTFFSAPKESCTPSVCGRRETARATTPH